MKNIFKFFRGFKPTTDRIIESRPSAMEYEVQVYKILVRITDQVLQKYEICKIVSHNFTKNTQFYHFHMKLITDQMEERKRIIRDLLLPVTTNLN